MITTLYLIFEKNTDDIILRTDSRKEAIERLKIGDVYLLEAAVWNFE